MRRNFTVELTPEECFKIIELSEIHLVDKAEESKTRSAGEFPKNGLPNTELEHEPVLGKCVV
jgi:hypothetical protein